MARVKKYVHAVDPETHTAVVLKPGDEVPANLAKVVTNPAVFEGDDEPEDEDEGDNYDQHNVTELRAELERRGLDTEGNKPDLVARLREYDTVQ